MASPDRIYFPGNPWPEGHPIEHLVWTGRIEEDGLYFHLDLRSERYYAERDVEGDDPDASAWKAPAVWGNYGRCSLSSTKWGTSEGVFVGDEDDPLDWAKLSEWTFDVDMRKKPEDYDNHVFHIYLLGHDTALRHHIEFTEPRGRLHRLLWKARVALTYVGQYELKYRLEVDADVTFRGFEAGRNVDDPKSLLERFTTGKTKYRSQRGVFVPTR